MIAADSSVLIEAMKGVASPMVSRLREALRSDSLRLPPPVVTELLSFPRAEQRLSLLASYRQLELQPDFWPRAGLLRRRVLSQGLKARLGDALIAQCCIDAGVPLLTLDADFRHFEPMGLKLVA